MTYNGKTKTISIRLPHKAVKVLTWKARYDGVPLRSVIRRNLEDEAERISVQYDLDDDFGDETPSQTEVQALLDELNAQHDQQETGEPPT